MDFKKRIRAAMAYLLALAMILCLGGCRTNGNGEETTTVPEETTAAPVVFTLDERFTVVRPEEAEEDETEALKLIRRALSEIYGVEFTGTTDLLVPAAGLVQGEYGILIGATNRDGSTEAAEGLTCLDWVYSIDSTGVITIRGGSAAATLSAARAFLKNIFGYDANSATPSGTPAELTVGTRCEYRHEYTLSELTIGGTPIEDYTIVRSSSVGSIVQASQKLAFAIERLTGKTMKIVKTSEFEGGRAIYFGTNSRDGRHFEDHPGAYGYIVREVGQDIAIDFNNITVAESATEQFVSEYLPADDIKGRYDIALGHADIIGVELPNSNGLQLKRETTSSLADGIDYTERYYTDRDGKPVRAYIIAIERGAASVYTGTPQDGTVLLNKVSNVANQMKAANNNGKNAIAGVNADFFDMGGTCLPRGLCVKEGELLSSASDRPWFGVHADGSYVIGDGSSNFKKLDAANKIISGVGGSDILMSDGKIATISSTDFSTIRHPRTAVGYDSTGKLYLVVVDGRQPSVSNGASLSDLASIFYSLGCTDALNLDGGGSSTVILKNSAGNYVTKNSPSAGALRAVSSTLLVCLP